MVLPAVSIVVVIGYIVLITTVVVTAADTIAVVVFDICSYVLLYFLFHCVYLLVHNRICIASIMPFV